MDPLGARQQGLARIGEGALGGEQQQGVGGDAEGGGGFDRAGIAHLRLAHPQQSFFFAEINLDVPALDIGFDDDLGVEVFIGAEQKGGLTIKQLGALAQAISERGDDDQLQDLVSAGGTPHQAGAALEAKVMRDAVVRQGECFPGGVVGADLLGGGSGRSVAAAATARLLGGGMGAEEQMRVLAEAADGGGVRGKMLERGAIGIASVEGHEQAAGGRGGVGVEGGAQFLDLLAGALAEAGGARLGAIFLLVGGGGFFSRLGRSGGMAEGDGDQAAGTIGGGQSERNLQKALGAGARSACTIFSNAL